MLESSTTPSEPADSFDRIACELQALRETAGHVSYAELVRRITALRLQRGVPAAAAAPARSTVYNAFQTGRVRLDAELLRDIVVALGSTDAEADAWVLRCRRARRSTEGRANREDPKPSTPRVLPKLAGRSAPARPFRTASVLIVVCVALNLLGLWITAIFKLSVYLDMVGTAIASLMLGPWHGVAVALVSSNLGLVTGDLHTWEFTPVNIAGALIWGYGIRRFRLGASFTRFFSLNLGVAMGCSVVASPIVVLVFDGQNGHASVEAVLSLEALGLPLMASVFSANIITSIMDKLLTGFIGLLACTLLHRRFGLSAGHMPLVEQLGALRSAGAGGGVRLQLQSLRR